MTFVFKSIVCISRNPLRAIRWNEEKVMKLILSILVIDLQLCLQQWIHYQLVI